MSYYHDPDKEKVELVQINKVYPVLFGGLSGLIKRIRGRKVDSYCKNGIMDNIIAWEVCIPLEENYHKK